MRQYAWAVCLAAGCVTAVNYRDPKGWEDGSDLEFFVSRPELRPPKYMVANHHPEAITDGYWFVSPYTALGVLPPTEKKEHLPCQTGPAIYDGNGTLIWTGACMYDNRHTFGFKPIMMDGQYHLKFYLPPDKGDDLPEDQKVETGVVINNQYEEVSRTTLNFKKTLDSHEFRPQPNGKQALITTNFRVEKEAVEIDQGQRTFVNMGFQEIDMVTGQPKFDWDPFDHGVLANESCDTKGMHNPDEAWDWAHINSVDKNFAGDYLISIRHTSTVYKISGKDGSVMWRLGGCAGMSDFEMEDGVAFHWQHHARFRYSNGSHSVISLFDNASEDWQDRNPDIAPQRSSGKIIMLDHKRKTAKMLRRFDHPDGQTCNALGSVQTLGDDVQTSNVLVNWAWQGYISEYDAQDRLVMEAKWMTDRARTYRAYKYPWVGKPIEPPVMKVLPIGHSVDDVASAFYVSWNGATDVASWAFYGGNLLDEPFKLLATVPKQGFETSWVMAGAVKFAYAEALDAAGDVLGKSTTTSILPTGHKDFKVRAPLLEDVVAFDTQPRLSSAGSLSICKAAPARGLLATLSSLLVGGLALFGAFGVARKVLDEVLRRQQGYRAMSDEHDDFEGRRRHGRPRVLHARLNSYRSASGWEGPKKAARMEVREVFDQEKQIHELDWEQFCERRYSTSSD